MKTAVSRTPPPWKTYVVERNPTLSETCSSAGSGPRPRKRYGAPSTTATPRSRFAMPVQWTASSSVSRLAGDQSEK